MIGLSLNVQGLGNPCMFTALKRHLRGIDNLSWVYKGDFNELLSRKEKLGGPDKSFSGMIQLRDVVDDCDLGDLRFSSPKFTWNNKRYGQDNIQERLDRFLANTQWRDTFLNNRVEHLGFNFSYHRPILLVCSLVFSQVLAARLKPCLSNIISHFQSTFVHGRQIYDNVITTFESFHSMARKMLENRGHMALKLDMSKAYDRVEFAFLKAVLVKLNFPAVWISLIMDCISSSKLSFLLNGKAIRTMSPSRGLRQG
ncbi:hypothetical protein Ddye_028007 [Dipteronia dyeriana]|uniref:Reverse transcriptase domain-containing protein n=1 Tax=Dipteronia dyeriana TaxID=168575 RepID=A0AAD9TQM7_9ROSI|nr:hypothetical protein Ddye_028007 [Dipteronia dyeriana]